MKRVTISFAQTNPVFGQVEDSVKHALALSAKATSDLVVFPELFNTGYAFASRNEARTLSEEIPSGPTCQALLDESRRQNKTFVAGIAERSGERVYNSAVIASKGVYVGKYRKLHLFNKEKMWFTPGNLEPKVYEIDGYRLGVMICFDWIFPEMARTLALLGADILSHPSNLILPGYCQRAMAARAFENRVYTITANRTGEERRGGNYIRYTGESLIVSPKMEVIASASPDEVVCRSAKADIGLARNKKVAPLNDIIRDRRPRFYARLSL